MARGQQVLTFLAILLLLAVLTGVAARRLYRISWFFPGYLLAVATGEFLIFMWPRRFYVWAFWTVKEITYGGLKLGLALEIAVLAYRAFPAAQATARRFIVALLVLLALLLLVGVPFGAELPTLAWEFSRRLANGTALLLAGIWGVVLYYRLPLHRLHRAILRGLVPYLLIFAATRSLMLTFGWQARGLVNIADACAYLLMLGYWSWEVWRPPAPEPDFLRQLQPWRARI